jgi:hypothetical protein
MGLRKYFLLKFFSFYATGGKTKSCDLNSQYKKRTAKKVWVCHTQCQTLLKNGRTLYTHALWRLLLPIEVTIEILEPRIAGNCGNDPTWTEL